MADVFISYSNADEGAATSLYEQLIRRSVSCWKAPQDIPPGAGYPAAIVDAIGRAHVLILVFSEAANRSQTVASEVERAYSKGLRIIPYRLEDVPPAPSLELFVSSAQWFDATEGSTDTHAEQLARTILGHLSENAIATDQQKGISLRLILAASTAILIVVTALAWWGSHASGAEDLLTPAFTKDFPRVQRSGGKRAETSASFKVSEMTILLAALQHCLEEARQLEIQWQSSKKSYGELMLDQCAQLAEEMRQTNLERTLWGS